MDQEPLPPDLKWPKWRWLFAAGSAAVGLILGFIALFVQVPDLPLRIRILIAVAVLAFVLILPVLVWLWGAATVAYKRVRSYSRLHQRARRDAEELARAKEELAGAKEALNQAKNLILLVQEFAAGRMFELVKARYDREKLYIVLKIKEGLKLSKGDILVVVHMDDLLLMGRFIVTEERSDGYYAVGTTNIDPVWLGQMRQAEEITTLPYMFAILTQRKEQ